MTDLFETLDQIKQAPGMYLGRPSVSNLFMFLVGYEHARSQMNIKLTEAEIDFHEKFQPWLQTKFGVRSVTSWTKIIMLSCHDEKADFDYFFQLLDELLDGSEREAA